MIIDFNNMVFEDYPNFKGGEKQLTAKMFFDGTNRIMSAYLVPGASIGLHTHDVNSEILFMLKEKFPLFFLTGTFVFSQKVVLL